MPHLNPTAILAAIAASGATLLLALSPALLPAAAPARALQVVELPRVVITAARQPKTVSLPRMLIEAKRDATQAGVLLADAGR